MSRKRIAVTLFTLSIVLCIGVLSVYGKNDSKGNVYKTGLKIVKNPVTLTVAMEMTPDMKKPMAEREIVINAEKETNVKIEWIEIFTASKNEKLNLMFAANELPDVIYNEIPPNVQVHIANKRIQNLTKLYQNYTPNLQPILKNHPIIKKAITWDDGNIYSYVKYNSFGNETNQQQDCLYINKAWLDKLGLKVPETTEEFYQALKAFKEKDPNGNGKSDEIPFSVELKHTQHSLRSMFGSFGVLGAPVAGQPINPMSPIYMIKNSKVIFSPAERGYFEALNYFHKLYDEGLMDKESFTISTAQLQAKGKHKDYILGSYIYFNQDIIVSADRVNDYVQVLPLKGPKGDRLWRNAEIYPAMAGFVTSRCKTPEAALRWLDYWTGKPLETMNGPEGLIWEKVGNDSYTNHERNVKDGFTYAQLRQSNNMSNGFAIPVTKENLPLKFIQSERNLKKAAEVKAALPYLEKQVFRTLHELPKPDEQEYLLLVNDIMNYMQTFYAKGIFEGISDKQWQEHLAKLKSLKVEKVLKRDQKKFTKWLNEK